MTNETEANELVERWLARYTSEKTLSAYRLGMKRWKEFAASQGVNWWQVPPVVAESFPGWLNATGLAPASVNLRIEAVSSWHKWLVGVGVATRNPCALMRRSPNQRLRPRRWLSGVELAEWLHKMWQIDQPMLGGLLMSGMRAVEARQADFRDVTMQAATATSPLRAAVSLAGKGGQPCVYRLPTETAQLITKRIADGTAKGLMCPNTIGGVMCHQTVSFHTQTAARWAKIADHKRVTPHCIRRSVADWMLKSSGGDIKYVSGILNHRNITTTARYLAERDVWDERAFDDLDEMAALSHRKGIVLVNKDDDDRTFTKHDHPWTSVLPGRADFARLRGTDDDLTGQGVGDDNPWSDSTQRKKNTRTSVPLFGVR